MASIAKITATSGGTNDGASNDGLESSNFADILQQVSDGSKSSDTAAQLNVNMRSSVDDLGVSDDKKAFVARTKEMDEQRASPVERLAARELVRRS